MIKKIFFKYEKRIYFKNALQQVSIENIRNSTKIKLSLIFPVP